MPEALFLLVFTWYLLGILRLGKEKISLCGGQIQKRTSAEFLSCSVSVTAPSPLPIFVSFPL